VSNPGAHYKMREYLYRTQYFLTGLLEFESLVVELDFFSNAVGESGLHVWREFYRKQIGCYRQYLGLGNFVKVVLHVATEARTLRLFVFPLVPGLARRGYKSEFVSGIDVGDKGGGGFVPQIRGLSRSPLFFFQWFRLAAVMRKFVSMSPDVLQIHTPSTALSLLPILWVLKRRGISLVYMARGGFDESQSPWLRMAWRFVDPLRWAVWSSIGVVNVELLKRALVRGQTRRIRMLSLGGAVPNTSLFAGKSHGILLPNWEQRGFIQLCWAGRFSGDKRPNDFLRLVELLRDEAGLPVRAIVLGDGDRFDRTATNWTSDHIDRRGWVAYPADVFGECDLLISTSVREGYGMVVAEAGLVGTPTFAYANEGTEKAVPEFGGRLVAPGDVEGLTELVKLWALSPVTDRSRMRGEVQDQAQKTLSRADLVAEMVDLYLGDEVG